MSGLRVVLGALSVVLPLTLACAGSATEGTNPGECEDVADNDADGLFDCDDPDCAGASVCGSGTSDTVYSGDDSGSN